MSDWCRWVRISVVFMNNFMKELSSKSLLVARIIGYMACVVLGLALGISFERSHLSLAQALPIYTHDGQVFGQGQLPSANVTTSTDVDFKLFWQVWSALKSQYYQQPLKDKDLFYGALSGLAVGTGDPYTTFFEPKVAQEFDQSIQGAFGGIGAEIGMKDDVIRVVAPLPDTPASRAGIIAGDVIAKINGEETTGLSVDEAVDKIRGPKGTPVTLTLYRPAAKKPLFEVTITRDTIKIVSVKAKMLPGQIAYVEMSSFNVDTADRFDAAITTLLANHPKGFILDLRNDPGGLLDQAQQVAAAWVGDKVVVKERRQGKIFEELHGLGKARLQGIPTIVLVNQGSASASEIVAGALQDYQAATLVGTKTFGKGSVQQVQNFEDGSALKVTIAEWLTPKERTIHKTGLTPDITVEQTLEDYDAKRDPALDRAIGILTGTATSTPSATAVSSTKP